MEDKTQTQWSRKLQEMLDSFETITLDKIEKVSLLDRAETKYVMNMQMLLDVLEDLSKYYKVLVVNDNKKNSYQTFYFDTPDFEMYRKHHNGLRNRYKVRTREYLDSQLLFTEVKFKNNKNKTIKKRIRREDEEEIFIHKSKQFIQEKTPFSSEDLITVLKNNYSRITLIHKTDIERVTIDLDMEFFDNANKSVKFDNLVIVEIKQEKFSQRSDFIRLMHDKKIRSTSFSKYCVGVSLLYDDVKTNNFKEKHLLVEKLTRGAEA